MDRLARLRRAQVGTARAPHKPLLLLWLLGRFQGGHHRPVAYSELEEPVGRLIEEFGPPSRSGKTPGRAAWPFTRLERELWDPRFADGIPVSSTSRPSRRELLEGGATGDLVPAAQNLLSDPRVVADAARLLLDLHFTPSLAPLISSVCGLDLDAPGAHGSVTVEVHDGPRRARRASFAEEVLRAYSYACAFCGYDGALGRNPVGLEAAHVRWHSQGGDDSLVNGLALCSLHHVLFDIGVLGVTTDRRLKVSALYVARNATGRALDDLAGRALPEPRPADSLIHTENLEWHGREVFKA
jgi:putative restriction endonuclease